MRKIVDLKGFCEEFPFTPNQAYKLIRDKRHPLPYKKCGKKLLFDVARCYVWFDKLPGKDAI